MLAAAEPIAREQRQQDGVAGRHARQQVDRGWPGPHRRPIGKAVQRHESAFGLGDRIEAGTGCKWPLAAISRDRAINQAGIGWRDRGIVDAIFLHHAGGEILHHDIRPRDQFTRDVAPLRLGEIKRDAALVSIQADEGGTLTGEIGMFIVPGIVAAVRVLDLDDFGAKIGQRLRAGRTGDDPGEIHHQQTVERGWRALCSWRAVRQLRSGSHDRSLPFRFSLAPWPTARAEFRAYFRKGNVGYGLGACANRVPRNFI